MISKNIIKILSFAFALLMLVPLQGQEVPKAGQIKTPKQVITNVAKKRAIKKKDIIQGALIGSIFLGSSFFVQDPALKNTLRILAFAPMLVGFFMPKKFYQKFDKLDLELDEAACSSNHMCKGICADCRITKSYLAAIPLILIPYAIYSFFTKKPVNAVTPNHPAQPEQQNQQQVQPNTPQNNLQQNEPIIPVRPIINLPPVVPPHNRVDNAPPAERIENNMNNAPHAEPVDQAPANLEPQNPQNVAHDQLRMQALEQAQPADGEQGTAPAAQEDVQNALQLDQANQNNSENVQSNNAPAITHDEQDFDNEHESLMGKAINYGLTKIFGNDKDEKEDTASIDQQNNNQTVPADINNNNNEPANDQPAQPWHIRLTDGIINWLGY